MNFYNNVECDLALLDPHYFTSQTYGIFLGTSHLYNDNIDANKSRKVYNPVNQTGVLGIGHFKKISTRRTKQNDTIGFWDTTYPPQKHRTGLNPDDIVNYDIVVKGYDEENSTPEYLNISNISSHLDNEHSRRQQADNQNFKMSEQYVCPNIGNQYTEEYSSHIQGNFPGNTAFPCHILLNQNHPSVYREIYPDVHNRFYSNNQVSNFAHQCNSYWINGGVNVDVRELQRQPNSQSPLYPNGSEYINMSNQISNQYEQQQQQRNDPFSNVGTSQPSISNHSNPYEHPSYSGNHYHQQEQSMANFSLQAKSSDELQNSYIQKYYPDDCNHFIAAGDSSDQPCNPGHPNPRRKYTNKGTLHGSQNAHLSEAKSSIYHKDYLNNQYCKNISSFGNHLGKQLHDSSGQETQSTTFEQAQPSVFRDFSVDNNFRTRTRKPYKKRKCPNSQNASMNVQAPRLNSQSHDATSNWPIKICPINTQESAGGCIKRPVLTNGMTLRARPCKRNMKTMKADTNASMERNNKKVMSNSFNKQMRFSKLDVSEATIIKTAKELFNKRTRTLYNWLNPTEKLKHHEKASFHWNNLQECEKKVYIAEALSKYGKQCSGLMVNPLVEKLMTKQSQQSVTKLHGMPNYKPREGIQKRSQKPKALNALEDDKPVKYSMQMQNFEADIKFISNLNKQNEYRPNGF